MAVVSSLSFSDHVQVGFYSLTLLLLAFVANAMLIVTPTPHFCHTQPAKILGQPFAWACHDYSIDTSQPTCEFQ